MTRQKISELASFLDDDGLAWVVVRFDHSLEQKSFFHRYWFLKAAAAAQQLKNADYCRVRKMKRQIIAATIYQAR